jgi:hypothetical protein
VIHGFLFYAGGCLLFRRTSVQVRFNLALALEAAWEIVEDTPFIIDRYRTATIALGYTGDSVINSLSDIGCMALGFLIARRLPWPVTVAIGVSLELLTLYVIRDNLTLNVLMLIAPVDAIRAWQAA